MGASIGMRVPFVTLLLIRVQALAAPIPAITVFAALLLFGFQGGYVRSRR